MEPSGRAFGAPKGKLRGMRGHLLEGLPRISLPLHPGYADAMTIDRILVATMIVVGLVIGGVLVVMPQARDFRLPPYFWVLAAVAAFDLVCYLRARGAPGTMAGMDARLLGFALGIVLMVAVPMLFGAGLPKLF
jgi:hypothetical protein